MLPLGPAHLRQPEAVADGDATTAGTQLEAFFLRRVLAEARPAPGGMLSGGFAGDTFREMLDGALADTMSDAGGIGLAAMFEAQLQPGGSAEPAATLHHRAPRAYGAGALALDTVPVVGRQSSDFGERVDPITGERSYHTGVDLAAPAGTTVRAAGAGRVIRAETAGT